MSMDDDEDDKTIYAAVVNHEEQYSIWPMHRQLPLGWKSTGKSGKKPDCLKFIELVWTDMRPLSLRKHMEQMKRNPSTEKDHLENESPESNRWNQGPALVERLSMGSHPIEPALRPTKTAAVLKECIDREYVHIRFTQTCGGTELGMRLDNSATRMVDANFETGTGSVHLEGELTLDYVRVRCIADLDLAALTGSGHLVCINGQNP
jgi:uncharacterized protein YbdZ (MbtH family)